MLNGAIADGKVPAELSAYLKRDGHIFSALKTNAQLQEATRLLMTPDGQRRPYADFEREVLKLNETYNRNYLEAEYQFAQHSAAMAAKWLEYEKDADRYDGQYRTANDDRVRQSHRVLHNITLPFSDPFWSLYFPPNGWRCRCTVQQVRRGKYTTSDSASALQIGEEATTETGKDGKNRLEIFRFNPGKEKVLMPPANPYTKIPGAAMAKAIIEEVAGKDGHINVTDYIGTGKRVTEKQVKELMMGYAKANPEDFAHGLDDVKFANSSSYLMQHSKSYSLRTGEWVNGSTITLSTKEQAGINSSKEFKSALIAIRDGQGLSVKQEETMESMWHEILHAKSKTARYSMTRAEVLSMETVNEFVARHTYDSFVEKLGGKVSHKDNIIEEGLGYSSLIKGFRAQLKTLGKTEAEAVEELTPWLDDYGSIHQKLQDYLKPKPKKEE